MYSTVLAEDQETTISVPSARSDAETVRAHCAPTRCWLFSWKSVAWVNGGAKPC
jgi:hypothetical protein